LLAFRGFKVSDYATALNIKSPSLSKKFKYDQFTYHELIKLAELTGTTLCLLDDKDGSVVVSFID